MFGKPEIAPFDVGNAQNRKLWIRNKKGGLAGGRFEITEARFSRFLDYKPPTQEETAGLKPMSASRVIEVALQNKFEEFAPKAMKRSMAYHNMSEAFTERANQPGLEHTLMRDGIDSVQQSVELNRASNMQYLEMQFKFQWATKSWGVISNLLKTRHESTKKAISDVR